MGDPSVANPILPPPVEGPHRVKSNALHIEDTTSLLRALRSDKTSESRSSFSSMKGARPIDSAMASNAPPSIASQNPDDSDSTSSSGDLEPSRSREPLTQINTRDPDTLSRAPIPLRAYPTEPRLLTTDGPNAGRAAAEWKEKFIPIIHAHTSSHSIPERTRFFDELVEDDKDRYLPPLAAYYFAHPEHLPTRELSDRALKKIEVGFRDNPRIAARQRNVFQQWQWPPADAPRVSVEERLGPKDEVVLGEIAECEHCVREAKKSRLRKRASAILAPVTAPFRRQRRATMQDSSRRKVRAEEQPRPGETTTTTTDDAMEEEEEEEDPTTDDASSDVKSSSSKASIPFRDFRGRPRAATQLQPARPTEIEAR